MIKISYLLTNLISLSADGAQADSVQQTNEADWFKKARDFTCAEPSKSRPPSYMPVTLDGGELSASLPSRLTLRGRNPSPHCIRGWTGPRTGLDVVGSKLEDAQCDAIQTC